MMSDDETVVHVCSNPECRVAETGKCIEGYGFGECPHYGRTSDDSVGLNDENISEEDVTELSKVDDEDDNINLSSGRCLCENGASGILRSGESRVIVFVGPNNAGKTTIIASLYDLFQGHSEVLDHYIFAGSQTLPAFEHVCHTTRAHSLRCEPHTARTSLGNGVMFYHLSLCKLDCKNIINFILADRAGEDYKSVSDDISNAFLFFEIYRSDSISLLIDGSRMLDSGERHTCTRDAFLILQGMMEAKAFNKRQSLAIILTKVDEVAASQHQSRVIRDFDRFVLRVREHFGSDFCIIKEFQTAASPKDGSFTRGHGLKELLIFWSTPLPKIKAPLFESPSGRAIDKVQSIGGGQ